MFRPLATLLSVSLGVLVLGPTRTLGAFTLPVTSGNDTVDQNSVGTWCYYPSVNSTNDLDLECTGSGGKGDLRRVMESHLSQPPTDSLSIAYYSAGLDRLGGVGFPVDATRGKVYLCLSGQREDGRYKTLCEVSEEDNAFGVLDVNGEKRNATVCAVEIGQRNVTDGCYVPVGVTIEDDSGATFTTMPHRILQTLVVMLSLSAAASGRLSFVL